MEDLLSYRGDSTGETFDSQYNVPIHRFDAIDALEIDTELPARYIIRGDSFPLPLDFLLHPRGSAELLVGIHGAEQRPQSDLPKFQFVRSFLMGDKSALFLSDPTLLSSPDLVLGWMFGTRGQWVIDQYRAVSRAVQEALGVSTATFVGHSGGGFCAIAIASQIPGARAVAVNGQTVLERYEPWTIRHLSEAVVGKGVPVKSFLEHYRDRVDLREILKGRAEGFKFAYFGHAEDPNTMSRLPMLPLLAEHFAIDPEVGGKSHHGDVIAVCDWELKNGVSPHALPGTIIPFIDVAFGRQSTLDIRQRCDATW